MTNPIATIPLLNLSMVFIPVILVLGILWVWSLSAGRAVYALMRMLTQLLLIGYVLTAIFQSQQASLILAILVLMLLMSSWIALGVIPSLRFALYLRTLAAITIGGGFVLFIVSQVVLNITPWYAPQYMIPLAGMIFSNAMNSVSLAAERLMSELAHGLNYTQARQIAYQAALIPITNSLFAVGLVSLPGMMTGQILSGTSPLIAARYQIMVMCMIFAVSGIATACFLVWSKPLIEAQQQHHKSQQTDSICKAPPA